VVGFLILRGDRTQPQVREFSWANQTIGAENTAFKLIFNRAMNWQSVTQQVQIVPPLAGKTSWSGRRLAYTLTQTIPYGQSFNLMLNQATAATGAVMTPFSTTFKSRDLAFAYLGMNGDEAGRLILYNLTQNKKTVLTPENLSVIHFKSYPRGDRLLFSATERTAAASEVNAKLYKVTTGLTSTAEAGQVDVVLDNQDYQILKFDLAVDGERIVIQQAARQNTSETGLWQIYGSSQTPERINTAGAGDFLIAPDSQTLVVAQGQGLALVPLAQQATDEPLGFLPQFGMVLNFARDSSAATMVKFNNDFTRSLFLVTNQGLQKELLRTKGSILSTSFTAQRDAIYGLFTRLLPGKTYQEQPYIAKIDLKTGQQTELMPLKIQRNVTLSLAPDGSKLLFDQALESENKAPASPLELTASNIWALPLPATPSTVPALLAVGTEPQWLP
jgi:hypothetical protein